jgi:septal ring factor EnvC (AmiA/AmiB activator)
MFLFAITISFIFLSVLIRVNYDLTSTQQADSHLQKEIDKIKKNDEDLRQQIVVLTKNYNQLTKELDTTQELQRKQAIAVGEIKKNKKR